MTQSRGTILHPRLFFLLYRFDCFIDAVKEILLCCAAVNIFHQGADIFRIFIQHLLPQEHKIAFPLSSPPLVTHTNIAVVMQNCAIEINCRLLVRSNRKTLMNRRYIPQFGSHPYHTHGHQVIAVVRLEPLAEIIALYHRAYSLGALFD